MKKIIWFSFLLFITNISVCQVIVDVLVAYTPYVKNYTGSDPETFRIIEKGIADANESFSNSGINLVYNLVKIHKITY